MVDYQFLAMLAVVVAVVTRGSILPVVAVTACVAVVAFAYEVGARRYRRHQAGPPGAIPPGESDLTRWMTVMDRMLRSDD